MHVQKAPETQRSPHGFSPLYQLPGPTSCIRLIYRLSQMLSLYLFPCPVSPLIPSSKEEIKRKCKQYLSEAGLKLSRVQATDTQSATALIHKLASQFLILQRRDPGHIHELNSLCGASAWVFLNLEFWLAIRLKVTWALSIHTLGQLQLHLSRQLGIGSPLTRTQMW